MTVYGLMAEEWRSVPGYAGRYEVSNLGRVRSLPNSRRRTTLVLKPASAKRGGYPVVNLTTSGSQQRVWFVHRLVALAFLGPCPDGMEVCHNDGDTSNAALSNLRYDTPVGNQADRLAHGTSNRGSANGLAVLTEEQARTLKEVLAIKSIADVARETGVNYSTLRNIKNGSNWGWVS